MLGSSYDSFAPKSNRVPSWLLESESSYESYAYYMITLKDMSVVSHTLRSLSQVVSRTLCLLITRCESRSRSVIDELEL